MTKKLLKWLLLIIQLHYSLCQDMAPMENESDINSSKPRPVNRMDYDEWKPLGHGDPLKNDPTYDYVPPVLDRVHYWVDSHTTEPSYKRDILVLGVTAKKISPKISNQYIKISPLSDSNEFSSNSGLELPKIIRATSFRNAPIIEFRNQQNSYFPSLFYSSKPKPFAMMLPPPFLQKPMGNRGNPNFNHITNDQYIKYDTITPLLNMQAEKDYEHQQYYKPYLPYLPPKGPQIQYSQHLKMKPHVSYPQTPKYRYEQPTTPSVSLEKSNLVFQSTQTLSDGWYGSHYSPTPTLASVETNQVTWQSPQTNNRDRYETDHHSPAASSTHEIVLEQHTNVVRNEENNNYEELVIEDEKTSSSVEPEIILDVTTPTTLVTPVKENEAGQKTSKGMHVIVANSTTYLRERNKKVDDVTVVMATTQNTTEQTMTEAPKGFSVGIKEKQNDTESKIPMALGLTQEKMPFSQSQPFPKNHQLTFRHPGSTETSGFSMPQLAQTRPISPHFLGSHMNLAHRSLDPITAMTQMQAPPPPKPSQKFHQSDHPTKLPFGAKFTNTSPTFTSSTTSIRPFRHSLELSYSTVTSSTNSQLPTVQEKKPSALAKILDEEIHRDPLTSTVPPAHTTTVSSLTTDPIFSHYKQPVRPMQGPMYLIIQGHSKVATYKPTINKHGVPVVRNEITESRLSKPISKFEQFVNDASHFNDSSNKIQEDKKREARPGHESLLNIVRSGLGFFDESTTSVTE